MYIYIYYVIYIYIRIGFVAILVNKAILIAICDVFFSIYSHLIAIWNCLYVHADS